MSAKRKLPSWIDRFIEHAALYESPSLFRKWAGIATLGMVLEQKVWIQTTSPMYPNLYTFLISPPGGGKSRVIDISRELQVSLPDPFIAPTSVNAASIIDHLKECKRTFLTPSGGVEYNSMSILVGEFGTFMSQYEDDLMALLTDFYNVRPYAQRRRGNGGFKVNIERPQLNMLIGSTPANLMKFMPENAWGQGFTSRILFIFSDEKNIVDDFANPVFDLPPELIHDLKIINGLMGKFGVTEEYQKAVNAWRQLGETTPSAPKPTHPRLIHYGTRRKEHLYRLSMIAAIDRSNALVLAKEDFNRAMGWMAEAEAQMGQIFRTQSEFSDSAVMDEIHHFTKRQGEVKEQILVKELAKRVNAHAVMRVLEVMERNGMLVEKLPRDRFGLRTFTAGES